MSEPMGGTRKRERRGVQPGRRQRLLPIVTAMIAVAVATACDGGTDPGQPQDPPDPGALLVVVRQAPASVGGLLVELAGEGMGTVTSAAGHQIWQQVVAPGRTRVLVRGDAGAGAILRFSVPDRRDLYTVTVIDAAADASAGWARHAPSEVQVAIESGG